MRMDREWKFGSPTCSLQHPQEPTRRYGRACLSDEGVGLPSGFDPAASKRLGTRLVNALSKQLSGELTRQPAPTGADFTLHIPLGSATRV
jgi:two-component sensor histidine kinase